MPSGRVAKITAVPNPAGSRYSSRHAVGHLSQADDPRGCNRLSGPGIEKWRARVVAAQAPAENGPKSLRKHADWDASMGVQARLVAPYKAAEHTHLRRPEQCVERPAHCFAIDGLGDHADKRDMAVGHGVGDRHAAAPRVPAQ